MPGADLYDKLAKQYGIEEPPESVVRLTALVARQDAPLDEIAKVVSKDKALTARLLRAANPRAESEEDYVATTAEEALARTGLGCVLLLAMGTPLTLALVKTFNTMLGLKLESRDLRSVIPLSEEHVSCKIGFAGKAVGHVFLRMDLMSADLIAHQVLGFSPQEQLTAPEVNDAVGELLNIITGNFKSHLCDAGLDCRLLTPTVSRTQDVTITTVPGGGLERMAFRAGQISLFVDVTVNPWHDE